MSVPGSEVKVKKENWLLEAPYHTLINHKYYGPLARAALAARYEHGPFNLPATRDGKRNFASVSFPGALMITTASEGQNPRKHSERVGLRRAINQALKIEDSEREMPEDSLRDLLDQAASQGLINRGPGKQIKFFSEREPCLDKGGKYGDSCDTTFRNLAKDFPISYVYATQNAGDDLLNSEAERAAAHMWLDDMGGFQPDLVHPAWIGIGPHENANHPKYDSPKYAKSQHQRSTGYPRLPSIQYNEDRISGDFDMRPHPASLYTFKKDEYPPPLDLRGENDVRPTIYPFPVRSTFLDPETPLSRPQRPPGERKARREQRTIDRRLLAQAKAKGFDPAIGMHHFKQGWPDMPKKIYDTINEYVYGEPISPTPLKKGGHIADRIHPALIAVLKEQLGLR
jgi:hypothetical protein